MFHLARQAGKVVLIPHVPILTENNVRKGFYAQHQYLTLKKILPSHIKPVVTVGYSTGMRVGEILDLEWSQVNFHERVIRLDPGTTKNDEFRVVPISEELCMELKAQRKLRDKKFLSCEKVFFNHGTGKPIRDFRGAWQSARKKSKPPQCSLP